MAYELRTTALVAGTLGAATFAATLAVLSATMSHAEDASASVTKISDRLPSEASTSAVWTVDSPFEIRSRDGALLYRYDPVAAETTISAGFSPPLPMPRPGALVVSDVPLPLPKPAMDTLALNAVPLPLPKPTELQARGEVPMQTAMLDQGAPAAAR